METPEPKQISPPLLGAFNSVGAEHKEYRLPRIGKKSSRDIRTTDDQVPKLYPCRGCCSEGILSDYE
ncbi:hypothetical protein JTE90_025714 [Oedothorax gibbosus]|uniref:Uncharacterized protein n=1 Tax=Oedothorax gibbosus TaxID=931172 RepID=A0AAV6UI34_9ARAC|nr:hypothetical protein JTE90_025714 [Oedothorax gibbosus]